MIACNDIPDEDLKTTNVNCNTTESNTIPNNGVLKKNNSSPENIFLNYDDVLQRYKILLLEKHNHLSNISPANLLYSDIRKTEIESALQQTVVNSISDSMGYALYDMNADGQAELILMDEMFHIYSIFSQSNNLPILIDSFGIYNDSIALDSNGTIYQSGYGKGESSYTQIKKLSSNGTFEILIEYGCYDNGTDLEYYIIENNEKRIVEEQDILNLEKHYKPFLQNSSLTTENAGISFSPII